MSEYSKDEFVRQIMPSTHFSAFMDRFLAGKQMLRGVTYLNGEIRDSEILKRSMYTKLLDQWNHYKKVVDGSLFGDALVVVLTNPQSGLVTASTIANTSVGQVFFAAHAGGYNTANLDPMEGVENEKPVTTNKVTLGAEDCDKINCEVLTFDAYAAAPTHTKCRPDRSMSTKPLWKPSW